MATSEEDPASSPDDDPLSGLVRDAMQRRVDEARAGDADGAEPSSSSSPDDDDALSGLVRDAMQRRVDEAKQAGRTTEPEVSGAWGRFTSWLRRRR